MSNVHARKRQHNFKDLTGAIFGRWRVVRYHGQSNAKKSVWWCRCECGTEKAIVGASMISGKTKSCGCLESEMTAKRNRERAIHGMTLTTEWKAWKGAIDRCHNPNDPDYSNYGGRGIVVCEEWRESFKAFYEHIGPKSSAKHSLDRFPDTNGPYAPGNVRWATSREQNRNRRNVRRFEYKGKLLTFPELSKATGLRYGLLWERLVNLGWTVEEATSEGPRPFHTKASQ